VSYQVQIRIEPPGLEAPGLPRLRRLARWVLALEGAESGEVGVVLTDDEGIGVLNRQYLGRDEPTDVIAFGMGEEGQPPAVVLEKGPPYLGDIAISLERACEQAASYGHPRSREVELLLVHGLLHLLGYDDGEAPKRRHMQARQEELLASFERRRSLGGSFRAAFAGLANLGGTQRNMAIHIALAVLAVVLGAVLRLARWEWAVLVLTVAVVLVAEGLNTALEALVDLASPEKRPLARRAKDVAAAAVLLAAFFALVIGAILFIPRLWERLR